MSRWMRPQAGEDCQLAIMRNEIECSAETIFKFRYSADRFCSIFIDGNLVAHGPELGCPDRWYFQDVEYPLSPGKHIIDARVCMFSTDLAPFRTLSIAPGFYFENLSGAIVGEWKYTPLTGKFQRSAWDWGGAPKVSAALPEVTENTRWHEVEYFEDNRILHAPDLPSCLQGEITEFSRKDAAGKTMVIFDDYECFIGTYRFRGKGKVKISHAETPYLDDRCYMYYLKGNKGERNGSFFHCDPNIFEIDGEAEWSDYTWISGRYLIIQYDESVEIVSLALRRWGYPMTMPAFPEADGKYLELLKKSFTTLRNCSHDIYLDCPYFDQMMYSGDTLAEIAATLAVAPECKLPEKTLRFFAMSQNPDGSIVARYPCKDPELNGGIPSYTAYYLISFACFSCWKNDSPLIKELWQNVAKAAEYIISGIDSDGLWKPGRWMLLDWVHSWYNGIPAGGGQFNSEMNLLAALALKKVAATGRHAGYIKEAERWKKYSEKLLSAAYEHFFNPQRGLFANDIEKKYYAEHSQVLALLLKRDERIIHALHCETLAGCGSFFSFFYLEACFEQNLPELFRRKIDEWINIASHGLKTLPEEFGNPRSDCHGWGAHLLYHHFASVLGNRPSLPGDDIQQKFKLKLFAD